MTIGKVLKNNVKNVAKKTAEKATKTIAEKAGQKVGELAVVEKGSKQIRKLLKERKKQKPLSQGAKKKLANILQNPTPKKSDALVKLNQILTNEI